MDWWGSSWGDQSLHPHTLTVHQVTLGGPDADGVPQPTGEPVTRAWEHVSVQLASTSESAPPTQQVTERWLASGPRADWIRPGDRVTWNGADYRVDGRPATFTGGTLDHTELHLIRWKGGA